MNQIDIDFVQILLLDIPVRCPVINKPSYINQSDKDNFYFTNFIDPSYSNNISQT